MNQGFDESQFNPSLDDSIQFPNSFGNGGGENGERVNIPPPSPRSSLPLSLMFSHPPLNVGDGGNKRPGMPPRSPRSSFGHYQNPSNNDGGSNGGVRFQRPVNDQSNPPTSPYAQIPTTNQQNISMSSLPPLSSVDSLPPNSPYTQIPTTNQPNISTSSLPPLSSVDSLPPPSSNSIPPDSSSNSVPPPDSVYSRDPKIRQSTMSPLLAKLTSISSSDSSAPPENRVPSGFAEYSTLPPIPYMLNKKDSFNTQPSRKTHRRTNSIIPPEWDQFLSQTNPQDIIYSAPPFQPILENVKMTESNPPAIEDVNPSKNMKPPLKSTSAGVKRKAGKEIAVPSSKIKKLMINDESSKLPSENDKLTESEMKLIEGEDTIMKIAEYDPKEVRRLLAQRAQTKKVQNRTEMEDRALNVEYENSSLRSQLANAQRDNTKLMSQIKELMIRLESSEKHAQAMDEQMKLNDAYVHHMNIEIQRLKETQFCSQSERSSNASQ